MRTMLQDLRYAIRQIRNSPGFAITVIATLALGIGVNTAVFSVMNAVLLRMLPVREPKQLFYLTHANMPPGVGNIDDSRYTYGINVYNRLKKNRSAFPMSSRMLHFLKIRLRFGSQIHRRRSKRMK